MITTHTIQIQSNGKNWANQSTVATQNRVYEACIIATATQKTVSLATQELKVDEARTAELKRELADKLKTLGFSSEAAFHAAHKTGGDSRMGLVTDIRDLSVRIQKRTLEADRIRKVLPGLGDQVVVTWKSTAEAAQKDLKTAKFAQYRRQAYDLEIRTDISTVTKPER